VAKAAQIIAICCKLQNYIIDNCTNLDVPEQSGVDTDTVSEPQDQTIHLQDTCDTHIEQHRRRRDLESSVTRDELTEHIRVNGFRRPRFY